MEILQHFMLVRGGLLKEDGWRKFPSMGLSQRELMEGLPKNLGIVRLRASVYQLGPGPISASRISVWLEENRRPFAVQKEVTFALKQLAPELYDQLMNLAE